MTKVYLALITLVTLVLLSACGLGGKESTLKENQGAEETPEDLEKSLEDDLSVFIDKEDLDFDSLPKDKKDAVDKALSIFQEYNNSFLNQDVEGFIDSVVPETIFATLGITNEEELREHLDLIFINVDETREILDMQIKYINTELNKVVIYLTYKTTPPRDYPEAEYVKVSSLVVLENAGDRWRVSQEIPNEDSIYLVNKDGEAYQQLDTSGEPKRTDSETGNSKLHRDSFIDTKKLTEKQLEALEQVEKVYATHLEAASNKDAETYFNTLLITDDSHITTVEDMKASMEYASDLHFSIVGEIAPSYVSKDAKEVSFYVDLKATINENEKYVPYNRSIFIITFKWTPEGYKLSNNEYIEDTGVPEDWYYASDINSDDHVDDENQETESDKTGLGEAKW